MKVGIVDVDLIERKKHRFPNLACEKIAGYYQDEGATVDLLTSIDKDIFSDYDLVAVSKVFTDTPVPEWVINPKERPSNVLVGGTGFYFDKAPNLAPKIEHHMPDYNLYNAWIQSELEKAQNIALLRGTPFNKTQFMQQFKEYTDYSIGFLTRGCFRKCGFCVNQKYDHVFKASPLEEFYDDSRKKICFLDDNFFGCPHWKELLLEAINTGKPFKFKQGLDERLLTDEKCELLFSANYDGDLTFAFDNIEDYDLIESKLKLIRKYSHSQYIKFYVLVGYESTDEVDIENAFKRIELLQRYSCVPYLMRYQNKNDTPWKQSKHRGLYVSMARWCNQPSIFKKMSFREFAVRSQEYHKTAGTYCAPMKAMMEFEEEFPCIAQRYFDNRYIPLREA